MQVRLEPSVARLIIRSWTWEKWNNLPAASGLAGDSRDYHSYGNAPVAITAA
jgi:hypothetical protein